MTLETTPLTLAVDVGSSSVRAMIFDAQGQELNGVFVQKPYESGTSADGGAMIESELICELIFTSIDEALQQAGEQAGRIQRVAMDTLVGNLMGMDAQGNPTSAIYTWADTRGKRLVEELKTQLDVADYTRRTGCRIHTSYWPVRLLWLRNEEPEIFERTRYWLSLGEFVFHCLFGERRISLSTASWSGMLNRHNLTWDEQTFAQLPITTEQVSAISDEPFSGLSAQWAERWPALRNALWYPSVGDGVASNIGAGCADSRHVAISIGTSGAMRVVVDGTPAETPDGLFVYRVDSQRSLVGGALSNAGNLYAWLNKTLQTDDTLAVRIASVPPDGHGLTILPFLAGERAPGWNDRAQAVFMGMTFDTEPAEIVRAALEAIAYRFCQIASRLKPLLPADTVYIASGAPVLNSPVWMQILADVLGAPVYANAEAEATIRGAVFLANHVKPEPTTGKAYYPDMTRHTIYQSAIARQQDLYTRVLG